VAAKFDPDKRKLLKALLDSLIPFISVVQQMQQLCVVT
jgi:hypothetical protein